MSSEVVGDSPHQQTHIGSSNYEDILTYLDVWKFIRDYCPTGVISFEKLRVLGKTLVTELQLDSGDNDGSVAGGYPIYAKEEQEVLGDDNEDKTLLNETLYFKECVKLCDEIKARYNDSEDGLHCDNGIRTVADGTLVSDTVGSNFEISGCFVKETRVKRNEMVAKELGTTDILVVFEYKQGSSLKAVRSNRLRVVTSVAYIFLDDVRRKVMYAISVEGQWMTLWYFARDHCVRTTFNWWKDKATMISVFLSFMYAREEDLGFDHRIHLLPASENRRKLASRYIYELEDDTQNKHYYRTEEYIAELHDMLIVGRKTRVFRVVEVVSESDDADYKDRPHKVLKDTWTDAGSNTEGEIQNKLFANIEGFVNSSVTDQHARLARPLWVKNGDVHPELAQYRARGGKKASKDFRELFLCIKLESTGQALRTIRTEYLQVSHRDTYRESGEAPIGPFKSTSRFSSRAPPTISSASDLARSYPTKKRNFLVFDDLCQPIDALPNVGAAFGVLSRTILALLLMALGNWVHRDISAGNVMALWNPATKQWESKLADLEYAQVFSGQSQGSNPKIGTAYFMPAEILRNAYFPPQEYVDEAVVESFLSDIRKIQEEPDYIGPEILHLPAEIVVHNFYHDVESIFWIVYWIVTCCVGHQPSRHYVAPVFSLYREPNASREIALSNPIPKDFVDALHPHLQSIVPKLESLRNTLWRGVLLRQSTDKVMFSAFHFAAFSIIRRLADSEKQWYHVRLRQSDYSISQSPASEVSSGRRGFGDLKRSCNQDEGDEEKPSKKRFKDDNGTLSSQVD